MGITASLAGRIRRMTRRWARKRHGVDSDPVTLATRRIYIVPTSLGMTFGLMLFAMFLGAMNYANNLALALVFLLGALALVAMHHCHRNLAGLKLLQGGCEPVFAGEPAKFRVVLENPSPVARYELSIGNDHGSSAPARLEPGGRTLLTLAEPTKQRGRHTLDHVRVTTIYPFGLFRAWAYLHWDMQCIVYPQPSARGRTPPPTETDTGGAQDARTGEEDFAGLRNYHPGDSLRRIAWKAYAREQGLHTKVFAGTSVTSHLFDWNSLEGLDTEAKLSQLCRWIEDAHGAQRAFGLKLPAEELPANQGAAHRQRCLTALALFAAEHGE
jgi:uncharacterized protein (DUF58 family)